MNREEYQQWRIDALSALSARYTASEALRVVEWFDNIKGAGERDLVGEGIVNCFCAIADGDQHWNLYSNMMMRMWLYAPYILTESELWKTMN